MSRAGPAGGARRSLTLLFSPVQCTIAWLCVASPLSTNDVLMSETCAREADPATGAARAQRPWLAAGAPSSPGPGAGPGPWAPGSAPRACWSSPSPCSARPAGGLGGARVSRARGPRRPGSRERPAAPQAASSSSSSTRSGRERGERRERGGGGGAPGLRARAAEPGPFGERRGPRCAMVAKGRRQGWRRGGAGEGDRGRESGGRWGARARAQRKEPARGGSRREEGTRRSAAANPRSRGRTATCRPALRPPERAPDAQERGAEVQERAPTFQGHRPQTASLPFPAPNLLLPSSPPSGLPSAPSSCVTEHLLWAGQEPALGTQG